MSFEPEDDEDRQIIGWFKNHRAVYESFKDKNGDQMEILKFSAPKDSAFWIYFYHHIGFLHIVGDLGEAVHQWNYSNKNQIDLRWISTTGFGYYMGKLRASANEKGHVWDAKQASDRVSSHVKDTLGEAMLEDLMMDSNPKSKAWAAMVLQSDPDKIVKLFKKDKKRSDHWIEIHRLLGKDYGQAYHHTDSRYEWSKFLEEEGQTMFGDDYYEFAGIGERHDIRHRAHWIGLKLAFAAIGTPV